MTGREVGDLSMLALRHEECRFVRTLGYGDGKGECTGDRPKTVCTRHGVECPNLKGGAR